MEKHVVLLRVSTTRQGSSGLGLEAQRKAVQDYVKRTGGEILSEFVEVESGKSGERPTLHEALRMCKLCGAILTTARLDRISRDLHFITSLQKSKTRFLAVDLPEANEMVIGMIAVIAQYERNLICQRTKAALGAAKARGTRLGAAAKENLTAEGAYKGRLAGRVANTRRAAAFATDVLPVIQHHLEQGKNLTQVAKELSAARILTSRGKSTWTAQAVKNVLVRSSVE